MTLRDAIARRIAPPERGERGYRVAIYGMTLGATLFGLGMWRLQTVALIDLGIGIGAALAAPLGASAWRAVGEYRARAEEVRARTGGGHEPRDP